MKNTYTQLRQFIRENIAQALSEIVDPKQQNKGTPPLAMGGPKAKKMPRWAMGGPEHKDASKLPWEFGPEGYLKRPELSQKMTDLEYGSDSAPEWILAIALSNRAEEMIGYKQTMDPEQFKALAMNLYQNQILGRAGDRQEQLHDITSRIDAGDYFDDDIQDVLGGMQMAKTKDAAGRQNPGDIGQMELDFERYMQGIESGKVVELEQEDD